MLKETQDNIGDDDDYSGYLQSDESDDIIEGDSPDEEEFIDEPSEEEEQEEAPQQEEQEDSIDVGGEKIKLDDLKSLYKQKSDFEKTTTELSKHKEKLVEKASNIQRVYDNLITYVNSLVPPEPPMRLLQENPNEYLIAQETRKKIIEELNGVINKRDDTAKETAEINHSEFGFLKAKEEGKLKNRIPELKSEENFTKFRTDFKEIGKDLGFTDQEIDNCVDSRLLELVYYAKIGKRSAEKMKNALTAQKRIASKPLKRTTTNFINQTNRQQFNNKQAFDRLKKTGSLKDALKIDFD